MVSFQEFGIIRLPFQNVRVVLQLLALYVLLSNLEELSIVELVLMTLSNKECYQVSHEPFLTLAEDANPLLGIVYLLLQPLLHQLWWLINLLHPSTTQPVLTGSPP